MRVPQIRFAVGEPGDQLCPVSKIWNQKDDVYLTGKFTGGTCKISMHKSGVWAVAAPSESGVEMKPGNRRMKAWRRPAEFLPGWTFGPHIGVPRLPHTDHFVFDEGQTKTIDWIPKPDVGMKATIGVIFASADKTVDDLVEVTVEGDAYDDDYLQLANKQKVFIRIQYEPISDGDEKLIGELQPYADEFIAVNEVGTGGTLVTFMQGHDEIPWAYVLKWAVPPR